MAVVVVMTDASSTDTERVFSEGGDEVIAVRSLSSLPDVLMTRAVDVLVTSEALGGRWSNHLAGHVDAGRPPIAVVLSHWGTIASCRRSAEAGFNLHVVLPCPSESVADAVRLLLRLRADGRLPPDTFDVIRLGRLDSVRSRAAGEAS